MPKISLDNRIEKAKMTIESEDWVMEVGKRIRAAREAKGLTQFEVYDRTGIFPANLSKIKQGKQEPGLTTLRRLAEALETNISQFIPEVKAD